MSGRRTSWRLWAAVALATVLAVGLAAWAGRGGPEYSARLDPRNPGPDGAQAVAEVLADSGVTVEIVRSAEELAGAAPDGSTTVVVTSTDDLAPSATDRMLDDAASSDLLLVEPSYPTLRRVDPGTAGPVAVEDVEVRCASDSAELDFLRDVDLVVDVADAYPGAGCFTVEDGSLLAAVDADGHDAVRAFGGAEALTNEQVLRGDNAAVALRLLGPRDRLVWYVPDPTDATADEAVGLASLLPRALLPSLVLVLAAGIALVLWRGRRFGPLSTEPLPVVVRAAETARSRGRMYRRADDRAHAAAALRAAARRDLGERLGLPRTATAPEQARALAAALAARDAAETADTAEPRDERGLLALLADDAPPPATDQELLRLARELQHLTQLTQPSREDDRA
ncbi:DUF4350 domain-containing protein [Nocardioides sambongensis]|uniref:DUF4350 domain-containing protein n=1 Tax=Nocardioides sambongensis TaxID=2589074 RepID=UPI001128DF34|nr:DUF4350 domain-containing protein [Nocardioides sambongensis]